MNQNRQTAYILKSTDPAEVQKSSAAAAKALAGIIKTCLGPRAMQKMVLTKINSIEMTNDGNSILREMDVSHPSARCLIELSQTQDDETGDGTTSVIVLAAEILNKVVNIKQHPIKLCRGLTKAKEICLKRLNEISILNEQNNDKLLEIIEGSVSTKLCKIMGVPIPKLALETALKIQVKEEFENKIDIKNNIKIVKLLGDFKESELIDGILIEKDIIHAQMKRNITNPKILLLDTPLEYKKGESQTNLEFTKKEDFTKILEIEEQQIRNIIDKILSIKPDIVVTEKGICDLALSILYENGITAIRRVKRSDNIRISKATGATIINRIDESISEQCLGKCGQFDYEKIGDDYFCKFYKCKSPKAVTLVLKGPTKDILMELERNFMDAIKVAKNMLVNPRMVPGAGATEMAMCNVLKSTANSSLKISQSKESLSSDLNEILIAVANAFKIIPSVLISNSGVGRTLEILNILEKKNLTNSNIGVNGITGELEEKVIMEPIIVKSQLIKSAFDSVIQLLRVDGIIESNMS